MESKLTNKRVIAFVFLACFITVSIISNVFILTHTEHQHDSHSIGGGCETCVQLKSAESILEQCRVIITGIVLGVSALFAISGIFGGRVAFALLLTPVALKIRMNN